MQFFLVKIFINISWIISITINMKKIKDYNLLISKFKCYAFNKCLHKEMFARINVETRSSQ